MLRRSFDKFIGVVLLGEVGEIEGLIDIRGGLRVDSLGLCKRAYPAAGHLPESMPSSVLLIHFRSSSRWNPFRKIAEIVVWPSLIAAPAHRD